GRADGAAHRGGAGRGAPRPADRGGGRERRPHDAPRDRGLRRPTARQLRDPARPGQEDGRGRPREAGDRRRGQTGARARSRRPAPQRLLRSGPDVTGETTRSAVLVNVADLIRRPASRKSVRLTVPSEGFKVVDSSVPPGAPIDIDLELESLTDGVVLTGQISAPWEASCRRCLGPAHGRLDVTVRELYQAHPDSEEAFTIDGDVLALEPLVREAVLLELPLAPLCRPDSAGLCPECGADRNEVDCGHRPNTRDPRWSALDALRNRVDPPSN